MEFKNSLRITVEEVLSNGPTMIKAAEAIIDSQEFISPMAELVKTEVNKHFETRSRRQERSRRYLEAADRLSSRLVSSSEGPPTDVSDNDDHSSWRAYSMIGSDMGKVSDHRAKAEQVEFRQPKKEPTSSRSTDHLSSDSSLKVIQPKNHLFSSAVDYRSYRLIKTSARYDDDVGNELRGMTKKVSVQIKDRKFTEKEPLGIISFLQDFKSACDACNIHEGAAMCIFKTFLTGSAEVAVKSRISLPSSSTQRHEGALQSYSSIVNFLLKRYATDDNIAKLDSDIRSLRQGSSTPTEFAQKLWTKSLVFGSEYDGKALKEMFVEGIQASIRKTLRHWWAEHQDTSLEDITQQAESSIDLQEPFTTLERNSGYKPRVEKRKVYETRNQQARVLTVENAPRLEVVLNENDATSSSRATDLVRMSMSELIAAVESGEFDIDDTTSMDSVPYCRVCMNGSHRTSQCEQVKDLKAFIRARNKN